MRDSDFVESSTIHEGPRIHKQAERDIQVPCFMTGKRRNDCGPRLVMTLNVKLYNHLNRWTDPEFSNFHGRMYHKSVEFALKLLGIPVLLAGRRYKIFLGIYTSLASKG